MHEEVKQFTCRSCQALYTVREATSFHWICPTCQGNIVEMHGFAIPPSPTAKPDRSPSGKHLRELLAKGQQQNESVLHQPSSLEEIPTPLSSVEENQMMIAELLLPKQNQADVEVITRLFDTLLTPYTLAYFVDNYGVSMLVLCDKNLFPYFRQKMMATWPESDLVSFDRALINLTDAQEMLFGFCVVCTEPYYMPLKMWSTFNGAGPSQQLMASLIGAEENEKILLQIQVNETGKPADLEAHQARWKMEEQKGIATTNSSLTGGFQLVQTQPVERLDTKNGLIFVALCVPFLLLTVSFLSGNYLVGLLIIMIGAGLIYGYLKLAEALPSFLKNLGLDPSFFKKNGPWEHTALKLIEQKIFQTHFFHVAISVIIKSSTEERAALLKRKVEVALAMYAENGGNHFVLKPDPTIVKDLLTGTHRRVPRSNTEIILTKNELCGFWHAPIIQGAAPGLLRLNSSVLRAPNPMDVSYGHYTIGTYMGPNGKRLPVKYSSDPNSPHTLIFGQTGHGKTTLLIHLILALLEDPSHPAIFFLDPHPSAIDNLMEVLPPEHAARVVLVDICDPEYLVPVNLLDGRALNLIADEIVQMMVDNQKPFWKDNWGPRMEMPLRYAVKALVLANSTRPADQQLGLTFINEFLFASENKRRAFLETNLPDGPLKKEILKYFTGRFLQDSPSLHELKISPIESKMDMFEREPVRSALSCATSRLSFAQYIQEGKLVLLRTHRKALGKSLCDFYGSTVINSVIFEIYRSKNPDQKDPKTVHLFVDEFQNYTGVDWNDALSQLRKFGGRLTLCTQSLASLTSQNQELPGMIFANISKLYIFRVNAEDAKYIANELNLSSSEILTNLPGFTVYERRTKTDPEKGKFNEPVLSFAFNVLPPPKENEQTRQWIMDHRKTYSIPKQQAMEMTRQVMEDALFQSKPFNPAVSQSTATSSSPQEDTVEAMPSNSQDDDDLFIDTWDFFNRPEDNNDPFASANQDDPIVN